MGQQLSKALKESHGPTDSPTLKEENKKTSATPFNSSSIHGISHKDEFTVANSSNGSLSTPCDSPITHILNGPRRTPKSDITSLVLVGARKSPMAEDPFILDSAATKHASGTRNHISGLTTDKAGTRLKIANGVFMSSHGSGLVRNEKYTFGDVHYVPGLEVNIVSIPALVDLNYSVVFKKDGCIIMDDCTNSVVGNGIRGESGLFELLSLRVPLD